MYFSTFVFLLNGVRSAAFALAESARVLCVRQLTPTLDFAFPVFTRSVRLDRFFLYP